MTALERLAIEHLLLRLRPLNRALRAAVARQAAEAARLDRPDLVPYCITDEQAGRLLDRVDALSRPDAGAATPTTATSADGTAERELHQRAAAAGLTLPLDELVGRLSLAAEEQDALLLCLAPELDRSYERIFAYVLDDLNRRFPCTELLCMVTGAAAADRLARRRMLGRAGRLRRFGLLRPRGDPPTELRQELAPAPGLVDFLLGSGGDLAVLAHDPGKVAVPDSFVPPPHADAAQVGRLAQAIRLGNVDLVGVWGTLHAGQYDVVLALAQAAGMPLRQIPAASLASGPVELTAAVGEALELAATLDALLWIPTDRLGHDEHHAFGELLTRSHTPTCLSGAHPWRPAGMLCTRAYAEIEVARPSFEARRAMWSVALPRLEAPLLDDLAARYRMSGDELRAVAALAGPAGPAGDNGRPEGLGVERAVAAVASRRTDGFAHATSPRRGPKDLVLPEELHAMVLEVAAAFRTWPRVAERWGFAGRSDGGVKALFTGEPGTGKTLAAEVIAGTLGMVLLKVDLARVISKWVGETEKNLEAAFEQAENSQAVLFFDEADALFGRRGDIKHGIDRYANLEVGFLLQRIEQADGLVILASNLKENIDQAFTRRFQYIVHFPRPGIEERQRIWRIAFPPEAPLGSDVDLSILAGLDMTGASIAGAARTAALLAADAGSPAISMAHVVRGVSRQYQRDARLLRSEDLGVHAIALEQDRRRSLVGERSGTARG
jgi:hypothetical protein